MIDWVHEELIAWGQWAARKESGGLGFPDVDPMFAARLGRPAQPLEPFGFIDGDHAQIDALVRELPPIPKMVCIIRYQYGMQARRGGEAIGCGQTAFGRYLSDAHIHIGNRLNVIRERRA